MLATHAILASRTHQIQGEVFVDGGLELLLPVSFGPTPNSRFYTENSALTVPVNFGPPPNSLLYAENSELTVPVNFGPPPNNQFYAENMDSETKVLFSRNDFIGIYDENEEDALPLQFGSVGNWFVSGDDDQPGYTIQFTLSTTTDEQRMFFSPNDETQVVPFALG